MNWNRDLDQVEAETLNRLRQAHYTAVTKKHIIHFKEIYDFISRFADPSYASTEHEIVTLKMEKGDIPVETLQIIHTIGADKLSLYFSPQAYPKKFFRFCEKLILTKRISSEDYIADGVIVASRVPFTTTRYSDIPF